MHGPVIRHWRTASTVALLLVGLQPAADAADPEWLMLQTPRFGVVSQLSETATRRWALEFDRFVDALRQLYSIDERNLPPLTIVLFESSRSFDPYVRTIEGRTGNVAGFLASPEGSWSVIGMSGGRPSVQTRAIIYHEAVHWVARASTVRAPMWLEEGLAEVFSTFEVRDGMGRWGAPVETHPPYLNAVGLQPLEEFFAVTRDEAIRSTSRFYPQAWAFTHYLMFGRGRTQRDAFREFLRLYGTTDLESAFTTAFGRSFDEMTDELRRYLREGRYAADATPVRDRSNEMTAAPASQAQVEFALARLALGGGNLTLTRQHLDVVLGLAPNATAVQELVALLAWRNGDALAEGQALDRAIALGSQDSLVFVRSARRLVEAEGGSDAVLADLMPDTARAAADLLNQAISYGPLNEAAYTGLATVLPQVATVTPQERNRIAVGRRLFPTNGLLLVAEADGERRDDNLDEALKLVRRASRPPFEVDDSLRESVQSLYQTWLRDWLDEVLMLGLEGRTTEATARLDEQLADPSLTGPPRTGIEGIKAGMPFLARIHEASIAGAQGREDEERAALQAVIDDPAASAAVRRLAQARLDAAAR